jgi:hypothetical protein
VQQAANCQPTGVSPAADKAAAARYTSAAYLRLVLAMVLLHSYRCIYTGLLIDAWPAEVLADHAIRCGSSTSDSPAAEGAAAADQAEADQQQLPDLWDIMNALWRQLVVGDPCTSVEHLAGRLLQVNTFTAEQYSPQVFAIAVQDGIDTELRKESAMPAAADSGSSTSGSTVLPAEGRLRRESLCLMLQELAATLCNTLGQQPRALSAARQQQQQPHPQQALTRQQQQLLKAVCLDLPQVLLRTALLLGDGQPQLVSSAVGAATWAMSGWRMARQAAGAEWQQEGAQLMMPGVIDAWLFLTGGLLGGVVQAQRQPSLLLQVAATGRVVQHDSAAAQVLRSAGKCTCVPDKSKFPTSSSSSFRCVSLDCASLMAVEQLLVCLGVTTVSTIVVPCSHLFKQTNLSDQFWTSDAGTAACLCR